MNTKSVIFQKLFEESELESLKAAVSADRYIISSITKLLNQRKGDREQVNSDDPNWIIKRAMYDGQIKELNWLISILTDKE